MNRIAAIGVCILAVCPIFAQERSGNDQPAIEQIIEHWNLGWQTKNANLASQDYSNDADWTNAFGMKRKGQAEIQKFLTEVFSLPFVMAGESKTVEQSIRFVRPDVAFAVTRVERVGQRTPTGDTMAARQTSHLRLFVKSGAAWKIVSHLVSDARDPERRDH